MRLAVAIGVIAVTLAAAVYIHQRHIQHLLYGPVCLSSDPILGCLKHEMAVTGVVPNYHPSWEDPVAVLLAIGGVAVAVGIVRH